MNNSCNRVINKIIIICFFAMASFTSIQAQKSKIGIIFDADTTLETQHIGFTIFSNSTSSSLFELHLKEYIIQKLQTYLEDKYFVDIVSLPDSLRNTKLGLLESGIGKKLRRWGNSKNDDYDILIFIRNQVFPSEWKIPVTQNSNGIYTRRKSIYLYTTITFYAYQTEKNKLLDYYNLGGDLVHQLKGFTIPKDQNEFNSEDVKYLKEEYEKYLNQRIEHFLSKTFLMPNLGKK